MTSSISPRIDGCILIDGSNSTIQTRLRLNLESAQVRRLLPLLLVSALVAGVALQVFDLATRHQFSALWPNSEWDRYLMGVYHPWAHIDEFRARGYVYTVHYTTFQLFGDSLVACKVLNLAVYLFVACFGWRALRKTPTALLAFVVALTSPKALEYSMAASPDFLSMVVVFMVWLLGYCAARGGRYALAAGTAALTIWGASLRIQTAIVILISAIVVGLALRKHSRDHLSRLSIFLAWVVAAAAASLPLFATAGNWKNIAVAVLARRQNLIWPDIPSMFQPGFPGSLREFLSLPNCYNDILANWLFNVQSGILRYLLNSPFELTELAYPPLLTTTLLIVLALCGRRLFQPVRLEARIALSLFVASGISYGIWCVAFLMDRFVLYSLPIFVWLVAQCISFEQVGWRRRGAVVVVTGCFVASAICFSFLYREWLNPYSAIYLRVPEMIHETDTDLSLTLVAKEGSGSYDYGLLFFFTTPKDVNAPERNRLYLPKDIARSPASFRLVVKKDDRLVAQYELRPELLRQWQWSELFRPLP